MEFNDSRRDRCETPWQEGTFMPGVQRPGYFPVTEMPGHMGTGMPQQSMPSRQMMSPEQMMPSRQMMWPEQMMPSRQMMPQQPMPYHMAYQVGS